MDKKLEIKEQLAVACRKIYEKNMVCGSGGNISARLDNTIFITPSGYSLGAIEPNDIVEVSLDGEMKGSIKPSKELFLHIEAYKARPDINVVIHIHSFYSIVVGITAKDDVEKPMPNYTPGYTMRVPNIALVPFFVPGSQELAQSIREKIGKSNVVLMKNHGMVIVSKDLENAFNVAEEVEENAKMHVTLKGQGALTEQQVGAILEKYN